MGDRLDKDPDRLRLLLVDPFGVGGPPPFATVEPDRECEPEPEEDTSWMVSKLGVGTFVTGEEMGGARTFGSTGLGRGKYRAGVLAVAVV